MTTRYEFSYGGDKIVRLRFVDVEVGEFQDYTFDRKEFTEFIDNAFYTLVETGGGLTDST